MQFQPCVTFGFNLRHEVFKTLRFVGVENPVVQAFADACNLLQVLLVQCGQKLYGKVAVDLFHLVVYVGGNKVEGKFFAQILVRPQGGGGSKLLRCAVVVVFPSERNRFDAGICLFQRTQVFHGKHVVGLLQNVGSYGVAYCLWIGLARSKVSANFGVDVAVLQKIGALIQFVNISAFASENEEICLQFVGYPYCPESKVFRRSGGVDGGKFHHKVGACFQGVQRPFVLVATGRHSPLRKVAAHNANYFVGKGCRKIQQTFVSRVQWVKFANNNAFHVGTVFVDFLYNVKVV